MMDFLRTSEVVRKRRIILTIDFPQIIKHFFFLSLRGLNITKTNKNHWKSALRR